MSSGIRILIVEDEFLTLNNIRESLHEMGYQISGIAKNAEEAIAILDENNTDFVILDIHIQGERDGIWVANEINKKYYLPFVFLTAYSDPKTVQSAIKVNPYGYLLKPFNTVDIYTSIEVALKNFEKINASDNKPKINIESSVKDSPIFINDQLFIKENHLYSKIYVKDILFIKAEMKFITLKTSKKLYSLRYTFSEFTSLLPESNFIQVHRSYVVNKLAVDHIGANYLIIDKLEIPISNQRKEQVYNSFKFV